MPSSVVPPLAEAHADGVTARASDGRRDPAPDRPTLLRDAVVLGLAATLVYWLFRQHAWFLADGQGFLFLALADAPHPYHTFYLPLLSMAADLAEALGATPYDGAVALSAVGGGVAVALLVPAYARLGLGARETRVAGLLTALCPALFFFATVVEVPAVFLACAAPAILALVEYVRRPGVVTGGAAVLLLVVAYLAHPVGVMIGTMLPVLWAIGRVTGIVAPDRHLVRALGGFALLGAALALVVWFGLPRLAVAAVAPATAAAAAGDPLEISVRALQQWRNDDTVLGLRLLALFTIEWLLPFAPLSLFALPLALARRATRAAAAWLLAAIASYVVVAWMLLVGIFEHGSYLLPLVVPTAALTVLVLRRLPGWLTPAVAVVAALGSVLYVQMHETRDTTASVAAGMQQIAGDDPLFVLSGTADDLGAMMMYEVRTAADRDRCWNLAHVVRATEGQFHVYFDGIEPFLPGICMLISERALQRLRDAVASGRLLVFAQNDNWLDDVPRAALLLEYLETRWHLEPVAARGFDGYRVRLRADGPGAGGRPPAGGVRGDTRRGDGAPDATGGEPERPGSTHEAGADPRGGER